MGALALRAQLAVLFVAALLSLGPGCGRSGSPVPAAPGVPASPASVGPSAGRSPEGPAGDAARAEALGAAREGEAAFRAGEAERARDLCRRAARLDPTSPGHFLTWGLAARTLDRLPEALEALGSARALSPRDPRILYELGETLRLSGRAGEAEPLLRESFSLDPRKGASAYGLALCLAELRRPAEALPLLEQVLRRSEVPQAEAPVRFLLARCLTDLGRESEAAVHRARFEALEGLEAEVRREGIAVESHPSSPKAHLGLAAALRRAGRLVEARESYRRARALAPRDRGALAGEAWCAAALETDPRALSGAEALARLALEAGEEPLARAALGWIAHRRGDAGAARRELRAAREAAPDDPGILEWARQAGAAP